MFRIGYRCLLCVCVYVIIDDSLLAERCPLGVLIGCQMRQWHDRTKELAKIGQREICTVTNSKEKVLSFFLFLLLLAGAFQVLISSSSDDLANRCEQWSLVRYKNFWFERAEEKLEAFIFISCLCVISGKEKTTTKIRLAAVCKVPVVFRRWNTFGAKVYHVCINLMSSFLFVVSSCIFLFLFISISVIVAAVAAPAGYRLCFLVFCSKAVGAAHLFYMYLNFIRTRE